MLKCFSLAEADAHVTNEIIEVNKNPVEPLVKILSANEYREVLGEILNFSSSKVCYVTPIRLHWQTIFLSNGPVWWIWFVLRR